MKVTEIDERNLDCERTGGNFVVFAYEGGGDNRSWSVDSYLLTEAHLSQVLSWLTDNLPAGSCWALGVVEDPSDPTPRSDLRVSWVVGADVLNQSGLSPEEQRVAEAMIARRHHVAFP